MSIRATCSGCGKTVKGGDDWAGRSAKCPGCGASITFESNDPLAGLDEFIELQKMAELRPPTPPPLPPIAAPIQPQSEPWSQPRYEYRMEQIPPTIVVQEAKGREAADYLQRIVNRLANDGWEFFRVDEVGVHVAPGCLGVLMGVRGETQSHYVVTFRRVVR